VSGLERKRRGGKKRGNDADLRRLSDNTDWANVWARGRFSKERLSYEKALLTVEAVAACCSSRKGKEAGEDPREWTNGAGLSR